MKKNILFVAIAMFVIAVLVMPASAHVVQIADGKMIGVSESVQVSANINYEGRSVYQYSGATMKCSVKSIQLVGNVNIGGRKGDNHIQTYGNGNAGQRYTVEQQATGVMKRAYKSIQVVANVNIT